MTGERQDPTLGTLPDPDAEPARARPASNAAIAARDPSRRARWPWIVGATLLLLALAAVVVLRRDALGARLIPPPQQARTMQQADAALQAGRLTATDGTGARELYQAVLARDPDQLAAREGLAHVGTAALAQAQAALRDHHPQDARRALDLARDLAAPVDDVARLEAELRDAGGDDAQVARWLAQAAEAERAGHLDDGTQGALALYNRILTASPDDPLAIARRRALLAQLLAGNDALLAHDDLTGARRRIDRVAAVDPGHLDLPAARAKLAEAAERGKAAQSRMLDRADADLKAGRREAAVAAYRKVLTDVPDDARAHAGLRSAAIALLAAADQAIAAHDLAGAEALLAQARTLAPDPAAMHASETRLHRARAGRTTVVVAPPATNASIEDLLAAADHAITRDELVDPPGDSAFDKLRAAAAIAPRDPRVVAAMHRFAATAAACHQREMTANHLARADACFEALALVQPSWPKLASLRAALATRWLAIADERLGAGEIDNAQRAIASAKRWAPNDPAIPALTLRLQQARAGAHR